ncbi:hypothetical protein [Devosia sp. XK-2]|uniref:hypothetical protein n=1 Tax=Devosia sp. XK-2 TaxID=3126689 RepID=UPI0030CD9B7B
MNDIEPTPVARSTTAALLHAMPAILLILGYLWLAAIGLAWVLSQTLFGGALWALVVCLLVFCGAALLITIRFVPRALAAERYPD